MTSGVDRRSKMILLASLLLTCLLRSPSSVEALFFDAIGDMRTLLDHQNAFVEKLDDYVKQEEQRLDQVKQFLGKVESRFGGPQVSWENDLVFVYVEIGSFVLVQY